VACWHLPFVAFGVSGELCEQTVKQTGQSNSASVPQLHKELERRCFDSSSWGDIVTDGSSML